MYNKYRDLIDKYKETNLEEIKNNFKEYNNKNNKLELPFENFIRFKKIPPEDVKTIISNYKISKENFVDLLNFNNYKENDLTKCLLLWAKNENTKSTSQILNNLNFKSFKLSNLKKLEEFYSKTEIYNTQVNSTEYFRTIEKNHQDFLYSFVSNPNTKKVIFEDDNLRFKMHNFTNFHHKDSFFKFQENIDEELVKLRRKENRMFGMFENSNLKIEHLKFFTKEEINQYIQYNKNIVFDENFIFNNFQYLSITTISNSLNKKEDFILVFDNYKHDKEKLKEIFNNTNFQSLFNLEFYIELAEKYDIEVNLELKSSLLNKNTSDNEFNEYFKEIKEALNGMDMLKRLYSLIGLRETISKNNFDKKTLNKIIKILNNLDYERINNEDTNYKQIYLEIIKSENVDLDKIDFTNIFNVDINFISEVSKTAKLNINKIKEFETFIIEEDKDKLSSYYKSLIENEFLLDKYKNKFFDKYYEKLNFEEQKNLNPNIFSLNEYFRKEELDFKLKSTNENNETLKLINQEINFY